MPALWLAERELLAEFGGLIGLSNCDPAYLERHGIGGAKAATVIATFEIAKEDPGRRTTHIPLPVSSLST